MQTYGDRGAIGAEIDGIVDELVEQLNDEIGCAGDLDSIVGDLAAKPPVGKGAAIRSHRGAYHGRQIEALTLAVRDGLLDLV